MAQVKERGGGPRFISHGVKTESPFPRSFFCSETKRKRLLRRLVFVKTGIKQAVVSIRNLSFLLSDASDWTQYP